MVVIESGLLIGLITNVNAFWTVCLGELLSTTRTVKLKVPTVVGIPVSCPLDNNVTPRGKVPEANDQVYGVVEVPVALNV